MRVRGGGNGSLGRQRLREIELGALEGSRVRWYSVAGCGIVEMLVSDVARWDVHDCV